jgi:hypothetical protein
LPAISCQIDEKQIEPEKVEHSRSGEKIAFYAISLPPKPRITVVIRQSFEF